MKGFRYGILILAGFCVGWGAQSVMGIGIRKAANSRFLSESGATLTLARQAVAAFRAREGRFPKGPGELFAKGDLNPADPPVESMHKGARWAPEWDGEGGFVYLSGTGELYLNADVSREKFFRSDWKRVFEGGMFPKGKIL
jgi:hypothetical protein